jgi:DNA polymerase III epsilon subunit-like protein
MVIFDEKLLDLQQVLPEIVRFISVDVETSGPNPSQYSILSIGACTFLRPQQTFYVELKPVNPNYQESALIVSQLSLDELKRTGKDAEEAMMLFEEWVQQVMPEDNRPVFVAFNAPFDWMFVADYFYRYLGRNPFGHNALDIKAYYMGMNRINWSATSMRDVSHHYMRSRQLTHHALQDAKDQSEMFTQMLIQALLIPSKEESV